MDSTLKIEVPVLVSDHFAIIGIVNDSNGCCKDRPILITGNKYHERINYSCQCACGMWCTSGHTSASAALLEYENMTIRKFKEDKKNATN